MEVQDNKTAWTGKLSGTGENPPNAVLTGHIASNVCGSDGNLAHSQGTVERGSPMPLVDESDAQQKHRVVSVRVRVLCVCWYLIQLNKAAIDVRKITLSDALVEFV